MTKNKALPCLIGALCLVATIGTVSGWLNSESRFRQANQDLLECKSESQDLALLRESDCEHAEDLETELLSCEQSLFQSQREVTLLKNRPLYESECVRKFMRCDRTIREIGDGLNRMDAIYEDNLKRRAARKAARRTAEIVEAEETW